MIDARDTKEEQLLLQRAKEGDTDSFEALILGCQSRAYHIAYRYLSNEEDALDAVQESFIKIFRYLNKFQGKCRFDTWVHRIVVNTCNDMLRKNSSRKILDSLYKVEDEKETLMEIPDSSHSPEVVFEKDERMRQIIHALDQLNQEHRIILLLRDMEGFSYEEISEILDCSIGTVKSRINRARIKLREILLEQS